MKKLFILFGFFVATSTLSLSATEWYVDFDISAPLIAEIGAAEYSLAFGVSPRIMFHRVVGLYGTFDVVIPLRLDQAMEQYYQSDFQSYAGFSCMLAPLFQAVNGTLFKLLIAPGFHLYTKSAVRSGNRFAGVSFGPAINLITEYHFTERVYMSLGMSVFCDLYGAGMTQVINTNAVVQSYHGMVFMLGWQPRLGVGIHF